MEYQDLPEPQKQLIIECLGRDNLSELKAGVWDEVVRLAQHDVDFRSACVGLDLTEDSGILHVLITICRSVNAKIACEYALA